MSSIREARRGPGGAGDAPRAQKIDHIGIAVRRIDDVAPLYDSLLGLRKAGEYIVAEQKVKAAFLRVGESTLELLEPTDPSGPVSKFLDTRGPGLHHVAYRVADIRAELARLSEAGVQLIDRTPRTGAGGALIAFLHPKATGGVLTELVERRHEH